MEHQDEHRMKVPNRKGVSRIEVLDGPTDRRRWPDDLKARIVAESFAPGARVCDGAEKYWFDCPALWQWCGLARKGKLVLPADGAPSFVPLVVEPATVPGPDIVKTDCAVIRVEIAGAVLHIALDCSPERAAALAAA